jgi:hypothetical protein
LIITDKGNILEATYCHSGNYPNLYQLHVVENLKAFGLFKYRGSRGGRQVLSNKKIDRGNRLSESASKNPIPVIRRGMGRTAIHLSRCRSPENLIPIVTQPSNVKTKNRSFAVPIKFLFTNNCSLSKTKNRVRAAVALEADLTNDIDICIVSKTHLKSEMPDSTVNIANIIRSIDETEIVLA